MATYFTPQVQAQALAGEGEGEGEEAHKNPQKLEKKNKKINPLLPAFVEHFPLELAGLLGDYYSNCAVATEDGKFCGLGQGQGFDFKDPAASDSGGDSKMINCGHECSGDLCPQWFSLLLNNMPAVVNVAKIESETYSGYTPVSTASNPPNVIPIDGVEIIIFNPDKRTSRSWDYLLEVKTGSQASPTDIAGACRALGTPNKFEVEMMLTLKLQNSIPFELQQAMVGKILISFPDRDGGKYFARHLRSWNIDRDGNFYAMVNLPSRPHTNN